MPFFRVLGAQYTQEDKVYRKDDIVESQHDLAKAFPQHFELVSSVPTPSLEKSQPVVTKSIVADPGEEVTDRFPKAVELGHQVFLKDGLYWVYSLGDLSKPLNATGMTKKREVTSFLTSLE